MRLAVTVGFDADLVIRALASIKADELYFLRGVTGGEGDSKSETTVKKIIAALKRGSDYPVELKDLAKGLRQISQLDFDAVALAGGPRLLVVLAFVAATAKGAWVYIVPEYSPDPVDATALTHIAALGRQSDARLRVLAALTREMEADEVAHAVGLDASTAYRHLSGLEEAGLVEAKGSRRKKYRADPLTVELASILLARRAQGRGAAQNGQ
ncbi:MAG: CRISPR-associated CARF protein Csa3 [Thermoproteus sp.]